MRSRDKFGGEYIKRDIETLSATTPQVSENTKRNKHIFRSTFLGATILGLYFTSAALAQNDTSNMDGVLAIAPEDTMLDYSTTTTIDLSGTTTSTLPDGTVLPTLPDQTVVDTTIPGSDTENPTTTNPDSPSTTTTTLNPTGPVIPTTTLPNTSVPTTTSPETTLPPLEDLNISMNDNIEGTRINLGQTITYTVTVNNPDNTARNVSIRAGFIDSFAISRITGIRLSNCGQFDNQSGPLHVYITGINLQPNQTCQIEYDALVEFPDRTATSRAYISDLDKNETIIKQSATLYS